MQFYGLSNISFKIRVTEGALLTIVQPSRAHTQETMLHIILYKKHKAVFISCKDIASNRNTRDHLA